MSISPLLTFKAGICEIDGDDSHDSRASVTIRPRSTPGYIYVYSEDDLVHFCWRPRDAPLDEPELDLLMFPMDGTYKPYKPLQKPTNGRIFALKFNSSSQKYFFWLQSQSQHPSKDPSHFSPRDLKLGEIINDLLQGEEVDVRSAMRNIPQADDGGADEDETMEDVEGVEDSNAHRRSGGGGAGPGATGGDIRGEGEGSREGGADGGRAGQIDASSIIRNFINSMPGNQGTQSAPRETLFTTLADLLPSGSTIPWIDQAEAKVIDQLFQHLPPTLVIMAQETDDDVETDITHASTEASLQALSLTQKKDILRKVLRSPQFAQSLASLTVAIRDGGLPILSESLGIPVRNGGYMRRGGMPIGGGEAVEAFLDGVKEAVAKEKDDNEMES